MEEQIKKEIKEAVEHMLSSDKDFKLVRYWFGNTDNKCACPLGCLIAKDGSKIDGNKILSDLREKYKDLPEHWLGSFIDGFDGLDVEPRPDIHKDAFKFGQEIFYSYKDKIINSKTKEKI